MTEPRPDQLDAPDRADAPGASGAPGERAPRFEEALGELESLVDALERGALTLDESVDAFEKGQRLLGVLNQRLRDAERRVKELLVEGSEVVERPLDDDPGEGPA